MPVTKDLLDKISYYEKQGYTADEIISGIEQSPNYPDVAAKIKNYRKDYTPDEILEGIKQSAPKPQPFLQQILPKITSISEAIFTKIKPPKISIETPQERIEKLQKIMQERTAQQVITEKKLEEETGFKGWDIIRKQLAKPIKVEDLTVIRAPTEFDKQYSVPLSPEDEHKLSVAREADYLKKHHTPEMAIQAFTEGLSRSSPPGLIARIIGGKIETPQTVGQLKEELKRGITKKKLEIMPEDEALGVAFPFYKIAGNVVGDIWSLWAGNEILQFAGIPGRFITKLTDTAKMATIGSTISSAANLGFNSFLNEVAKARETGKIKPGQSAANIAESTLFGAGLGLVNRIANPFIATGAASTYAGLATYAKTGDPKAALQSAATMGLFTALTHKNTNNYFRNLAYQRTKLQLAEYVKFERPDLPQEQAEKIAEIFLNNALEKAGALKIVEPAQYKQNPDGSWTKIKDAVYDFDKKIDYKFFDNFTKNTQDIFSKVVKSYQTPTAPNTPLTTVPLPTPPEPATPVSPAPPDIKSSLTPQLTSLGYTDSQIARMLPETAKTIVDRSIPAVNASILPSGELRVIKKPIPTPEPPKAEIKPPEPTREIPEELKPKPLLSRFIDKRRVIPTKQDEYTNGVWLLKPEFTPAKLKEKVEEVTLEEKPNFTPIWENARKNLQSVSDIWGYIKDGDTIIYIVKTADGQNIGIPKEQYDYLKKYIPDFNLRGSAPNKPLIIYSGDKEAGLLAPIRPEAIKDRPIIQVSPKVTPPPEAEVKPPEPIKEIPSELKPLAEEARKYKSAEEFIKFLEQQIPAPVSGTAKMGIKSKLHDEYVTKLSQLKNLAKELVEREYKKRVPEITNKDIENEMRRLYELKQKAGVIWAQKPFNPNSKTIRSRLEMIAIQNLVAKQPLVPELRKEILADFYNLATKGAKEVKPEVPTPPEAEPTPPEVTPPPEKSTIQGYVPIETSTPLQEKTIEPPQIIKKSDIIKFLSEKLDIPIRQGHFRSKRYVGIYKSIPDIIRWKKGDLPTISHEIGHYLQDNIPELDTIIKRNKELTKLDYDYPQQARSSEGFAEFIRLYITNPEEAKTKAPKFYDEFEKLLDGEHIEFLGYKGTEIKDILLAARKNYQQWLSMPAVMKVKSQISFNPEKPKMFNFGDIYTALVDDLHPLEQYVKLAKQKGIQLPVDDDPYILARLYRGVVGKANHFLEYKTFNAKTLEINGKGLREILEPVSKKNALDDFNTYLVAARTIELSKFNISTGITKADALETIRQLHAKYPEFRRVAKELYDYQDRLLLYAKDSGLLSDKTYNLLKKKYKLYVPLYRVFEELQRKGYLGKKFANISQPIKRIRGSEREIIPPIESIIKNTYTLISAADRNQVGIALINLSTLDKELGRIVEEVPPEMAKVANVDLNQILSKDEIEKLNIPEELLKEGIDIFRPTFFNSKDNILTVLIDGKKRFFQVEPDLYKALLNLDREELGLIIKILSYPARALRAGATLSLEFLGRNPFRDQLTAFVFSKYGYKPFIDVWGGLASALGKDEAFWAWMRGGGAHSVLVSLDRNYIHRRAEDLLKSKISLNPLEVLRALGELGEQATRLGEFKKGIYKKNAGLREAAFASREVTVDFSRHGAKTVALNSIIAFWNANTQGVDRAIRAFNDQPKRTMLRILMGITIPSIILYLQIRKSKRYNELPQWQKDYFWIIETDENLPLIRIPKPFELGVLFGSGVERFLDYIDRRDPKILDNFSKSLFQSLTPNALPTALTPVIENITNYSFFRNRPIVSKSLERMMPELQYYQYTPSTMRWLGKFTNIAPVKLENLIRGYFGGLGGLVIESPDIAMKVAGKQQLPLKTADIPLIKGFIARDPYGFVSESAIRFYDEFEKITRYHTSIQELMKDGKIPEARRIMAEHPEYAFYNNFSNMTKTLGTFRKVQEFILERSNLSPEEKQQRIDDLNKRLTQTIETFMQNYYRIVENLKKKNQ